MEGMYEAKLNASDRKELNDSDYGLPDERKYPLNDEEHVRKAIQFFKYCPSNKRAILAKNINKKIKEFDMDVTVSEDNPFYRYANRIKVKVKEASSGYMDGFSDLDVISSYNITTESDFINLEKLALTMITEYYEGKNPSPDYMNALNIRFSDVYSEFKQFKEFYKENTTDTVDGYELIDSCPDEIVARTVNGNTISGILGIILNHSNTFHAYRCIYDTIIKFNDLDGLVGEDRLNVYSREIHRVGERLRTRLKTEMKLGVCNDINPFDSKYSALPGYDKLLNNIQKELENEIYIINSYPINKYHTYNLNAITSYDGKYNEILSYAINPENITQDNTDDTTTQLEPYDIMYISKALWAFDIYTGKDINGDNIYYAIDKGNKHNTDIRVVTKSKILKNKYYMFYIIPNTDFMSKLSSHEKCTEDIFRNNTEVILSLIKPVKESLESIHEKLSNIQIDKSGDIKIEISPNKNYMDSYSENHKFLVENWKNKNYDAMKKNLSFAFALISIIERSDEYKKRDPETVKARAFLINDFKTYLKQLQTVEPEFDFSNYYIRSDYDKKVINVPKTTIIGAKNLLRAILA